MPVKHQAAKPQEFSYMRNEDMKKLVTFTKYLNNSFILLYNVYF